MSRKPEIQRSREERSVHRFSYALQLWKGADLIANSKTPERVGFAPGYLLICFSLENALACFLICMGHSILGDWKGHDIAKASIKSKKYKLILSEAQNAFINRITPLHLEHAFRYPERIDQFELPSLIDSCRLSKEILNDVQTVLAMNGFDLLVEAEKMPTD